MAKVTMLNMAGAEAGTIELKDEIFGITLNENAVHAVVKNYLANQRGHAVRKDQRRSQRGRQKAFQTKRNRSSQTRQHDRPVTDRRRHRIRAEAS